MVTEKYSRYINDLPRYGLAIVFVWFGVDKFVLREFYVNWLTATERVKILLPIQDLSLSLCYRDCRACVLLANLEVLYKENDGSLVVFIEGRSCVPRLPENICVPKLLISHPPEFLNVATMKAEVIGTEKEVKDFLQYAGRLNTFKILGLTSLNTKSESLLSRLTNRQKQVIITAYALGYYDVPRKISSEDLARHLNADKSTIVEHLRRAQRKLIGGLIAN